MVAAVCFRQVAIRTNKIPLPVSRAGVVARRGSGIHPKLSHKSSPNVVPVEVAANTELFQLNFLRAEQLARPTHRVIRGMVKVENVIGVYSDLGRKEFRVPKYILRARVA